MKAVLLTLGLALCFSAVEAQTPYKPKKRKKDYFGKKENPNDKVRPIGLQLQLGPTYTFTKRKNEMVQSDPSATDRFQYVHDPKGDFGIYAEIGLVRFNVKDPKFKFGRFVDYFDFGIGYKLLRGSETTTLDQLDATGNIQSTSTGNGKFSNGYLYGRFSLHKLQYVNKTKNIFLDHSLGINGDYLVTGGDQNYQGLVIPQTQYFSDPFRLQLHYGLGFGIRLKKGVYLVPGVQLPILGIQDWNNGSPSLRWYSSKYYPVQFQIKYIRLFPAKQGKGCYEGDPAERKKNEEYMQNR